MRLGWIIGFSIVTFHTAVAAQNPPECITRVGSMSICQYAENIAIRSNKAMPQRVSTNIQLVKITSDKNRLTHHFVASYMESEVINEIKRRNITKEIYRQEFLANLQYAMCKPKQATQTFINNGGIVTPEFVSAEGNVIAQGVIDSCNRPIQVANQNVSRSAGPLNLTLARTTTEQHVDIQPASELAFVLSTYAADVRRKFMQVLNMPHDENGNTTERHVNIQLIIGPDGVLKDTIPSIPTDTLTKMAIRQAYDASPYPAPPMALLKAANEITISIEYGAVKHTYTRNDKEFYDRP